MFAGQLETFNVIPRRHGKVRARDVNSQADGPLDNLVFAFFAIRTTRFGQLKNNNSNISVVIIKRIQTMAKRDEKRVSKSKNRRASKRKSKNPKQKDSDTNDSSFFGE
jgi:hypothetical protein